MTNKSVARGAVRDRKVLNEAAAVDVKQKNIVKNVVSRVVVTDRAIVVTTDHTLEIDLENDPDVMIMKNLHIEIDHIEKAQLK